MSFSKLILPASAALLFACSPDIASNTYFCGPEGLCPPGLQCSYNAESTLAYSCDLPNAVKDFECGTANADVEPDDTTENAFDLGALACGSQLFFPEHGCIENGTDIDHFKFRREQLCQGEDPHVAIRLQASIAAAPLSLTLLGEDGSPVGSATDCSDGSDIAKGLQTLCLDATDLPAETFTIRIQVDDAAGSDCDGKCLFNRYSLSLSSPSR